MSHPLRLFLEEEGLSVAWSIPHTLAALLLLVFETMQGLHILCVMQVPGQEAYTSSTDHAGHMSYGGHRSHISYAKYTKLIIEFIMQLIMQCILHNTGHNATVFASHCISPVSIHH